MGHLNVEIKAQTDRPDEIRLLLAAAGAEHRGCDHQRDTYFHCARGGRLKLRQGTIETALIHYDRPDQPGPKPSRVHLYRPRDAEALRETLSASLGVRVVVEKQRDIYFLGNVKLHVDQLPRLGSFVEIEAIDVDGTHSAESLRAQCEELMATLGIGQDDLLTGSYAAEMVTARDA